MKPRAKTMRPRAGQAFVKRFDHKQRLMRMNLELREALETQQELHKELCSIMRNKIDDLSFKNDFMRGLLPQKNLAVQFFESEMTQANKEYLDILGIRQIVTKEGCYLRPQMNSFIASKMGLMADLDLGVETDELYTMLCTSSLKQEFGVVYLRLDGLLSSYPNTLSSAAVQINRAALSDHNLDLLLYSAAVDIISSLIMKVRVQLRQGLRSHNIRTYDSEQARERVMRLINDDAEKAHKRFLMDVGRDIRGGKGHG